MTAAVLVSGWFCAGVVMGALGATLIYMRRLDKLERAVVALREMKEGMHGRTRAN